jgi:hypothetical protein
MIAQTRYPQPVLSFARSVGARRLWSAYLLLTATFWICAFGVWGGSAAYGSQSVHLGWQGVVVNAAVLIPAVCGRRLAVIALLFEATVLAGIILSMGVPPVGPPFGALGLLAVAQAAVLIGLSLRA